MQNNSNDSSSASGETPGDLGPIPRPCTASPVDNDGPELERVPSGARCSAAYAAAIEERDGIVGS